MFWFASGRIGRVVARLFRVQLLLAVMLAGSSTIAFLPAGAAVQKVLFVCVHGRKKEICPQFRAGLKAPDGWVEDRAAEAKQGRVIFVPRGRTFENAPFAITAATTPNKTRTSIEALTEKAHVALRETNKDATILPLIPVPTEKLGAIKLYKIVDADLKPRAFEIEARFADKDAEGTSYVVEVTLSAMIERGLVEAKPKLEGVLRGS